MIFCLYSNIHYLYINDNNKFEKYLKMADQKPITHLTSPIVTGSTVIGIKFDKGVILACDTMLSYGGLLSKS